MAKWLRNREIVKCVEYQLCFDRDGESGAGYAFPCDEYGFVKVGKLADVARQNYDRCRHGLIPEISPEKRYIHKNEWSYVEPAAIRCEVCRVDVELDRFTNTCDGCGSDYNMSGHRLAPREQWGEETGEHWTECY